MNIKRSHDKHSLKIIDGGKEEMLARRILRLILLPREDNQAEINRLLAILHRRGDLSGIQGAQDDPQRAIDNKQGTKK